MRRRPTGVSFMELVVSAALLFVCLGAIVGLLPSSAFLVEASENRMQANLVGQSTLERYTAIPYPDLSAGDLLSEPEQIFHNVTFAPEVEIRSVPPYDPADLLEVVVTVRWTARHGRERSVVHSRLRNRLQR